MRALTRIVMLTLLLTACTDIISPPRVERYEYREFVSDGGDDLLPMAFHWPRELLPVKVWVADDDPLRPALLRAISTWENSFLYGEFRAELVSSADAADIIVRNEVAPPKLTQARRLLSLARECRGATDYIADVQEGTLTLPFEIFVWAAFPGDPNLPVCYEITVLHELGHAIGIFAHSTSPDDVMYADPVRNGLSERDRATAEAAYHLPATLVPLH